MSDEALVYTMQAFCQRPAEIMREIGDAGKPAFIAEHGRFIAIIQPLEPGQVESRVLAEMARKIRDSTAELPEAVEEGR